MGLSIMTIDKSYWHHVWTARVRPIKIWYILLPLIVSSAVAIVALRDNNVTMGKMRDTVYVADKNNNGVKTALQNLQMYVTTHMNTNLTAGAGSVYPPIQLRYTYQRLQDAAKQKASQENTDLYTAAQKYCEQQNSVDFSGHNRVPCIEQYVLNHGGPQPQTIPDSLYKFNFVSPTWSPDLAGWSLFISILLALFLTIRMLIGAMLARLTR